MRKNKEAVSPVVDETKPDLAKVAKAVEKPNAEQLKSELVRERSLRVKACEQEVVALLEKYNCALDATMLLKQGDVRAEIRVIAKE